MGQPFSGVGPGSWENGVWDYKALPQPGAREIIDHEAGASYSWDEGRGTIVSYDNGELVRWKVEWLRGRGLGGGMWWESSGDRAGEGSLMGAVSFAFFLLGDGAFG